MNRLLLTVALSFPLWRGPSGPSPVRKPRTRPRSVKPSSPRFPLQPRGRGALAALSAPTAVYTNPLSGEQAVGRDAIKKQFAAIFEQSKGAKLEAKTDSVQFISPSVAVEQGTAKVIRARSSTEESDYTAVYVKRDDQWLLDRVTEKDVLVVPSHYEKLKDLEWMIGRWVDQDDDATVVTECNWAANNNFLNAVPSKLQIGGQIDMAGMQVIGWDPSTKQIRSWVFDSDGGFGQGTWKKKGKHWYIQQNGVLCQ